MEEFLKRCRVYFAYAFFFSLFINLLMLTLPIFMLQVFDRVISSRSQETLVVLTVAAVFGLSLHAVLSLIRERLLAGAGIALDGMAGLPVLRGVLKMEVKPGVNEYTPGLRDIATIRSFLSGNGITSLFDAPWMPIFLGVIFMFHPLLGIIATTGGLLLFAMAYLNEKMTRGPIEETGSAMRRASYYIDAGTRNAEVVNALGMIGNLSGRWNKLNNTVIDAKITSDIRGKSMQGLTKYFRMILQILMLATGAWLVIQQQVSSGVMIAGTLILSRALAPIDSAITTWKGFIDARVSYKRLKELLQQSPVEEAGMELPAPTGKLEVDRIIYSIPKQDRAIIKGISFSLEAGESLGLIGPSAAGKSTLARLLIGIWRPISGTVRLDDADISTWPREHLGKYIGYLPQDVELFAGTVAENISRLAINADSEEIIDAARRANAHELILRLPKAYDTEIGVSGTVLSAGQRQRIALARAIYGKPSFVVLDEPNANLDTEGENALSQTLQQLSRDGVTVVTISHRPSLLNHVDKLLVLKDGQIEAFGPRAEVMQKFTPQVQNAGGISPVRSANQNT
ncbi:MAG: PrtD family type I secretion system ABC transporter [Gammaproteobacteria bacterium]|jgi:PrtD family type I secretion system ABC transporter